VAAAFCGVRARGNAKEEEKWISGALVVLMRALGEGGGRLGGSGSGGARGTAGKAPARGNRRGRRSSATRGRQREAKGWPGRLSTAPAGGAVGRRWKKQRKELEEGDKG